MRRLFSTAILLLAATAPAAPAVGEGESISGRVTLGDSGPHGDGERPLAGVIVSLRAASGMILVTAVTGSDGHYRFKEVPVGDYTVTPADRGYMFTPASRAVPVRDDGATREDFLALPTHAIVGRVSTTHGGATARLPLAGVALLLVGGAAAAATTDADGGYRFDGLLPGTYAVTPRYGFTVPGAGSGTDTNAMFSPSSRPVVVTTSDVTGQDFSGFNACAAITACVDSDGDGLCDAWEIAGGIDLNGDGIIDATNDLLLPGADPSRKDVYLEIDYMVAADHSHQPRAASIQAVVDAFARQGIALHVDPVHDAIPETKVLALLPPESLDAACTGPSASSFYELKRRYADPMRNSAYHYAIFGHYTHCDTPEHCGVCPPVGGVPVSFGSAGISELPGNDFLVATGTIMDAGVMPTVEQEAGLLMHELGHNFGLRHAGDADLPDFKPNFLSVMNDNFVYTGIPVAVTRGGVIPVACVSDADCPSEAICGGFSGVCTRIDYSRVALPTLDEMHLDERVGISAGTNDITTYNCPAPDFTPMAGAATGPIDWNCNGDASEPNIAADVNADGNVDFNGRPLGPLLTGYADWPNLFFRFQCRAEGSASAPSPERAFLRPAQAIRPISR